MWTGQPPWKKWKVFSGTWSATHWPRLQSGTKRMSFWGMARMIRRAEEEVTHTSHWVFREAVVLM